MAIDLNKFSIAAQSGAGRVILKADDIQVKSSKDKCAIQNAAVRTEFQLALKAKFGEVPSLINITKSSKNLSSKDIKNTIKKVSQESESIKQNTIKNSTNSLLAKVSSKIMHLPPSEAQNYDVNRLKSLATNLISSEYNPTQTTNIDDALVDRLLAKHNTPRSNLTGVEHLRDPDFMITDYSVNDKVKSGQIVKGSRVGSFIFDRLKDKGVEPGFYATLAMGHTDKANMNVAGHEYYNKSEQALDMALGGAAHDSAFQSLDQTVFNAAMKHYAFKNDLPFRDIQDLKTLMNTNPAAAQTLKNAMREDSAIQAELEKYVSKTTDKFSEMHIVKLDYNEKDDFLGKVHVAKKESPTIKTFFHRLFTAKSKSTANFNAIKETLSSDLMSAMGIEAQKARLIKGQYQDGSTKIMMEATFMSKLEADGTVSKFKDFAGLIKDGILTDGHGHSDHSIENFGRNKILMLLLADRDAIGSRGDNKGRMGNTFAAIDPGHSLEGFMSFKNVHSDFSFDQPSLKNYHFKNFSVFDDCTYMEKMQGVKQILDMKNTGKDLEVFNNYQAWLDSEIKLLDTQIKTEQNPKTLDRLKDDRLDLKSFQQQVVDLEKTFIERRDYILDEVFAERLPFIDDHDVLESLSNLEKLTSKTRISSKNGDIELSHLQVDARQEWHIAKIENRYVFSTSVNTGQSDKMLDNLHNMLSDTGLVATRQFDLISLSVPEGDLEKFQLAMAEQKVIAMKHPKA